MSFPILEAGTCIRSFTVISVVTLYTIVYNLAKMAVNNYWKVPIRPSSEMAVPNVFYFRFVVLLDGSERGSSSVVMPFNLRRRSLQRRIEEGFNKCALNRRKFIVRS